MTPIEKLKFRIEETKKYCSLSNRNDPDQVVILNQIALMEIMIDEMEVKNLSSNNAVSGSLAWHDEQNVMWIEAYKLFEKKEHSQDGRDLQMKHFVIARRQ